MNPCSQQEIEFLNHIHKADLIEKSIRSSQNEKKIVIIDHLVGSYFTVMGLPIHLVFDKMVNGKW